MKLLLMTMFLTTAVWAYTPKEQWTISVSTAIPPVIAITITPTSATVMSNNSQQFTAQVTGTINTAVTWNAASGSPTSGTGTSFVWTAPTVSTTDTTTVIATSVADPTKTATATITVNPFQAPPPPAICGDPGVHCPATCDQPTIQAAIDSAQLGDTVIIPALTCSWTTGVTITQGINLIGADQQLTNLINNRTVFDGTGSIVHVAYGRDEYFRISNMTITGGTPQDPGGDGQYIRVNTRAHSFRIDHIDFPQMNTVGIYTGTDSWGLIDHVTFSGARRKGVQSTHGSWQNVGGSGDNSWATPDTMGTNQQIVVEQITCNQPGMTGAGCVGFEVPGGRGTVRYSQLTSMGSHGVDSGLRGRSTRHVEVYENTLIDKGTLIGELLQLRGGTGMFYNNTAPPGVNTGSPSSYASMFSFQIYREMDGWQPWGPSWNRYNGGCNGLGVFDNVVDPNVYTGTVAQDASSVPGTGATSGTTIVDSGNPNWTTDQWRGYAAWTDNGTPRTGPPSPDEGFWGGTILSNDANSIRVLWSSQGQTPHRAVQGKPYHIVKIDSCIDGVGYGQGDLISGGSAGLNPTPPTPSGWVHQVLDPAYVWGNWWNGALLAVQGMTGGTGLRARTARMREFYGQSTAPANAFDGTNTPPGRSGVGVGPVANRPTTCTPRVAWWDQTQNGGIGELYVCTATNTWTPWYHPYVYPHPLQGVATMSKNGHMIETGDGRVSEKIAKHHSVPVEKLPKKK